MPRKPSNDKQIPQAVVARFGVAQRVSYRRRRWRPLPLDGQHADRRSGGQSARLAPGDVEAAKLVTDLVTLSDIGDKKRFSRILIRFKPGSTTDIEILHFKDGNNIISAADFIVTVTDPDRYGKYRKVKDLIDADGDGDADSNDRLIYRTLATSFASMTDPRP